MTIEETAMLVKIMRNAYPSIFARYSDDVLLGMNTVWAVIFKNYSLEEAKNGLILFIATDTKGFPPTPGQVIQCIQQTKDTEEEMSAEEACDRVRKALSNSIYHAREEFEKLPEYAQKVIGSSATLYMWAQMDLGSLEVAMSNFMRSYETVMKRVDEEKKIPPEIRALVLKASRNAGLPPQSSVKQIDMQEMKKVDALRSEETEEKIRV